jgi:hypothetical protein
MRACVYVPLPACGLYAHTLDLMGGWADGLDGWGMHACVAGPVWSGKFSRVLHWVRRRKWKRRQTPIVADALKGVLGRTRSGPTIERLSSVEGDVGGDVVDPRIGNAVGGGGSGASSAGGGASSGSAGGNEGEVWWTGQPVSHTLEAAGDDWVNIHWTPIDGARAAVADPADGSPPLANAGALAGAVAIVSQAPSQSLTKPEGVAAELGAKALTLEAAGAIAVIIVRDGGARGGFGPTANAGDVRGRVGFVSSLI